MCLDKVSKVERDVIEQTGIFGHTILLDVRIDASAGGYEISSHLIRAFLSDVSFFRGFHDRRREFKVHLLFLKSIPPHLGSTQRLFPSDIPARTFDRFVRRIFLINFIIFLVKIICYFLTINKFVPI